MVRRGNIGFFVGIGLLAEILVFAAVADRIGLGSAILLTFAASLLGVAMLRHAGLSAFASLRNLTGDNFTREGAFVDGMLGALGAVLLILPGFLTDLVGLFLLAPSGRQWLIRRLGVSVTAASPRPPRRDGGVIDLGAGDWTRIDNVRSP